jgi:hypothetical protein
VGNPQNSRPPLEYTYCFAIETLPHSAVRLINGAIPNASPEYRVRDTAEVRFQIDANHLVEGSAVGKRWMVHAARQSLDERQQAKARFQAAARSV